MREDCNSDESANENSSINYLSSWTKKEDMLLLKIKNANPYQTWVKIANRFPGKNPKQCSYRYKKLIIGSDNSKVLIKDCVRLLEFDQKIYEEFEHLKSCIDNKSIYGLSPRYLRRITNKLFSFKPEEDILILKLYNEGCICDFTHKLIIEKGIFSIRKRLEMLLENKGEKIDYKREIVKTLSILKESSAQLERNDQLLEINDESLSKSTTKIPSSYNNYLINYNELPTSIENNDNLLLSYPKSIITNFECGDLPSYPFNYSTKANDYNDFNIDTEFFKNFNENKSCFSKCKVIDNPPIPDLENDFSKGLFSISDSASKDEFTRDFSTYSNIESLFEKQRQLELDIYEINQKSKYIFECIDHNLNHSRMNDESKCVAFRLYIDLSLQEKNLIIKINSIGPNFKNQNPSFTSDQLLNDSLVKVELLGDLIKILKLKIQLSNKITNQILL